MTTRYPKTACPKCGGKGYYLDPDTWERYCDCPAGDRRKKDDGP